MNRRRIPSRVFSVLVYVFLYAPILLLIVFSFNAGRSNRIWEGFSLQWYQELLHNTRLLGSLRTTLILSVIAALVSTVLGTAAAIGFTSMRRRSRSACLEVNNIPLTNADIITGVSMLCLFVFAIDLYNGSPIAALLELRWKMGFGTLLIAHITFDAPYVILSVMPRLRGLDPNIYEAAQDLGASGWYAFRRVILPEIMPGVLNGLIIAFTMSIDDFVISYFTKGSGVTTLAVEIYTMVKKPVTPEINALSTLMFVCVFVLLLVVNLRQARQETALAKQKAVLTPDGKSASV